MPSAGCERFIEVLRANRQHLNAEVSIEVTRNTGVGMPHAYPAFFEAFPEANAALPEICEYVNARLALLSH